MIVVGALITIVGSLVVAVGRAGKRGMIGPEARIGIRTPSTIASSEAWYAAHETAGTWIALAGWVITVAGLIIMLGRPEGGDALRVGLTAAILAAAAVVWAVVVGNRAAGAVGDGDEGPLH